MVRAILSLLCLVLMLTACEEDAADPLHPLEGRYSGDLNIYDINGNDESAADVILNLDRIEEDTLLIDFENVVLNGVRLNDYSAVISNNSSMIIPAQSVSGEVHTGQGSLNVSDELEIVVKRVQDGSDVFMYTGIKQ